MKQQNLNELRDIYLNIATGEEGPEVLSETNYDVKAEKAAIQKRNSAFGWVGNQARRLTNAAVDSFKTDKNPTKGQDTFTSSPTKPPAKPTAASTDYKSKFAGARDAAVAKARQIQGSPVVGQRPAAAPTAPVKPAASAAPKPAASSANPMDTWARSNPGLARKVADSSTPQAGKDVISARVNADNDRGPSTPTPSSSSSTTSGSSSSSGETDRLKKALDIKKSDVTSSYQWSSAKTLKTIADAYSSVYEKKEYEPSRDQDEDDDNDFADNMIARMVASGMSRKEAIKKVKNRDYNKKDGLDEATRMAKRGHDETEIRNKIARNTKGGDAADRANALADKETFGYGNSQARNNYARKQMGDFRKTTSSSPGLHGYAHKSDDPEVKAKQAARGAQRSALTPREKKQLNREAYEIYEVVLNHLLESGFVDSEYNANIVIENMSSEWLNEILKEETN